ncbi:hypothetical protein [Streptomyces neyagawaensis]|uniref:Secreted protein n=1 Tax=Streptomyces neyagawaensis TaxID=42238 RepID=A0ABV3AYP8_9ACTN
MPALPARRLATSALCAALLLGVSAPAATADDAGSARDRARSDAGPARHDRARSVAPVPEADALLAQVKQFGDLGGVLKPVTDLLNAVLKAEHGRLSAARSAELGKAARNAIARARGTAPATPPATASITPPAAAPITPSVAVPVRPTATPLVVPSAAPVTPAVTWPVAASVVPLVAAPLISLAVAPIAPRVAAPAGPVDDALVALREAVDALLAVAVSGDPVKVKAAVDEVLSGVVKVVAATLLASGLPAPTDRVPAGSPFGPVPMEPPTGPVPAKPPVALSVE